MGREVFKAEVGLEKENLKINIEPVVYSGE